MPNNERRIELVARAAGLMLDRTETEYLHAKERAAREMGLPEGYPLPSNRSVNYHRHKASGLQLGFLREVGPCIVG